MLTSRIDAHVFSDASWWHWALTVPLLAAHLSGVPGALPAAMGLCAVMGVHYRGRLGGWLPMPAQVRAAYLALLLLGTAPGLGWIHWVQLFGTTAMVTMGYCPLVRMLTLAPWNRAEPLSRPFLTRLAFAPAAGGLWNWQTPQAMPIACSCSLDRRQAAATCCK